ncbi:hypothetical protein GGG16DRAFT_119508 [Schizophyllum commune]
MSSSPIALTCSGDEYTNLRTMSGERTCTTVVLSSKPILALSSSPRGSEFAEDSSSSLHATSSSKSIAEAMNLHPPSSVLCLLLHGLPAPLTSLTPVARRLNKLLVLPNSTPRTSGQVQHLEAFKFQSRAERPPSADSGSHVCVIALANPIDIPPHRHHATKDPTVSLSPSTHYPLPHHLAPGVVVLPFFPTRLGRSSSNDSSAEATETRPPSGVIELSINLSSSTSIAIAIACQHRHCHRSQALPPPSVLADLPPRFWHDLRLPCPPDTSAFTCRLKDSLASRPSHLLMLPSAHLKLSSALLKLSKLSDMPLKPSDMLSSF